MTDEEEMNATVRASAITGVWLGIAGFLALVKLMDDPAWLSWRVVCAALWMPPLLLLCVLAMLILCAILFAWIGEMRRRRGKRI